MSKKEEKAARKTVDFVLPRREKPDLAQLPLKRAVALPAIMTVKEFADRANLPVTQVISVLIKNGVLATINQTIDFETASIIGDDLGLEVAAEQTKVVAEVERFRVAASESLVPRPPVVTIMGHVDHGKTTLLDRIRETRIVEGESGGITQHISAYQVELPPEGQAKSRGGKDARGIPRQDRDDFACRKITFLDTPGHAAFSKMREHGASITDIVVLIIAADDGVMPQTVEVIKKAGENNVPIIVAINKVDLPDADVLKVKQQLTEYGLVPEEWGGQATIVEISAKTGAGLDNLLEVVLLQADLLELKANPKDKAVGVIIESHMERGHGALALVLIENGTIYRGDPVAIGPVFGRVRTLESYAGKRIDSAGPSSPVRIAGLKSLPGFGDRLLAFETEREAKEAALKAHRADSVIRVATATKLGGGREEKEIELNLIIKSDVAGSLEAIKKLLSEIDSQETTVRIVSEGVGPISESDATLARATQSVIIGFRVPILAAAKKISEVEEIPIRLFDVIYKLVDDVKVMLSLLLPPEVIEEELGQLKVLAIFRDDRKGFVAGGKIESGRLSVGDKIKVLQDGNVKYEDKIKSIRQEKSEVKSCAAGKECGFSVSPGAKIAVGDTVIAYERTERERKIE